MKKAKRLLGSILEEPLVLGLFILLPLCIDSIGMSDFAQNAGGKIIKLTSAAPFLFLLLIIYWYWILSGFRNTHNRYRLGFSNPDKISALVYIFFIHIAGSQLYAIYEVGGIMASLMSAFTFLSMAALFSIARTNNGDANSNRKFFTIFLASFILIGLVNFALVAAGIEGGRITTTLDDASNKTLLAIGIAYHRVQFPWVAGGLNGFSVLCLILFFLGFQATLTRGTSIFLKMLGMLAGMLAIGGIILVDSRGSVLALVVALLMMPLVFRIKYLRLAWPVAILLIQLSPLLIIIIAPYLAKTELFALLDRGYFSDPAAALTTGRSYIWYAAWSTISQDPTTYILGSGHLGHLVSGMSAKYAFIFPGEGSINAHTTHNSLLQTLVDRGILGILTYISFICLTFKHILAKAVDKEVPGNINWIYKGTASALTAVCVMGQTEAVLTPYFPASLYFLTMTAAIAFLPPIRRKKSHPVMVEQT